MDDLKPERFWQDGVAVLRGLVASQDLGHLSEQTDSYLRAGKGPITVITPATATRGRFAYGHAMLEAVPVMHQILADSPYVERVRSVLGCDEPLTLLDDQVYVKEPGTEEGTPWHQDGSYWATSGRDLCTVWLALDTVTPESGGLEFVLGSHRWNQTFQAAPFVQGQDVADPADEQVPDEAVLRSEHHVVCPALEPGDAVMFHASTLHSAGPNTSRDRRRRALVTRWAGDDVRYEPRPHASPRQIEKAARNGVRPGERFYGPEYPQFTGLKEAT